jgi:hypothetical protein
MGGIYEVRRSDDLHTKFHKDWFSHSKVDRGETQTHRQHGDRLSLLFQNKVNELKITPAMKSIRLQS